MDEIAISPLITHQYVCLDKIFEKSNIVFSHWISCAFVDEQYLVGTIAPELIDEIKQTVADSNENEKLIKHLYYVTTDVAQQKW